MARTTWWVILVFILGGCAGLHSPFEPPQVNVTSFRVLPGNTSVPRFEIALHVINPNAFPLHLQGLSYAVSLEGHQILTGVSNQLPQIAAYGEGDVLLQASPDLISTLSLFADLMSQPRESFGYRLLAKLDIGTLWPKIPIERSGQISLPKGR